MKDSEDSGRIKVVDRRRLDDSGDERDEKASGAAGGDVPLVGAATPGSGGPAADAAVGAGPGEPGAGVPHVDFVTFILSFSQTAFLSLGLGPHPETGEPPPVDLNAARWTIDALDMLYAKTKGNLTGEEERIFDRLLAELRMVYVQVATAKQVGTK
jgi:hypothetical protein